MNILLTGVSKSLGLKLTKILLDKGYTVFGISRTRTDKLTKLVAKYPNTLYLLEFDLLNVEDIRSIVFQDWIGFKTPIDCLINNAAIAYDDIISNLNLKSLEQMFSVNVYAPMILTKYCIRNMLMHDLSGSIVHISSISVHTGYKGLAMYAASKGALEAFSKNTAREWGEKSIRSNCLVAGFMETEMSSTLSLEQKARIYKRTSLKKAVSIDSVAQTIAFLISDRASSITGQTIHVDNGTI